MNTSQKLQTIKRELQAQKIAYQREATQLRLHTRSLVFATKKNACRWDDTVYPDMSYDYEDAERVVVTLDTPSGVNTLATLELDGDYDEMPVIRRVPYTGGARWTVTTSPSYNWNDHTWRATNYKFVVHSLVDGVLSACMFWEVS